MTEEVFPSILPDDGPFVDDAYSCAELERMEWDDLRRVAAEHPTEDVNGKMDRETIIDALEGEPRV